jgi:hypothetical protein
MRHVCIKCGKVWLPDDEEDGETTADLCERCLTYYIRGKQVSEGYHDCFKRSIEICSKRKNCKYFQLCCEEFIIEDMLKEHANV